MNIAAGINAPQRNVALGIVAHKKMTGCTVVSVCQHHPEERTMHLYPLHPSSWALIIKKPIWFLLRGPSRGCCVILEDVEAETQTSHCNAAIWWSSHPHHTRATHRHTCPCAMHTLVHWQKKLNMQLQTAEYNSCTPPYLFGGISLQFPDCLRNEGECSKWRAQADQLDYTWTLISYIP